MPTTRSMKTLSTLVDSAKGATKAAAAKPSRARSSKRKVEDTDDAETPPSQRVRVVQPSTYDVPTLPPSEANQILPAVLTFSFETAKQHLINVDTRFEGIFNKLPCRPFEQLDKVDPFRTLTTSIVGQQISWLAARSVTHKFIRLFYPHLPEKPPPIGSNDPKVPHDVFPTASQVANTDIAILKSAGLSTRKAEYVQDLASRFADGRLTNQKLVEADDEELARLLIEVRGIGRWTVDMFAIFSLRRPDILPVGDLGVQRGVVRWFLSLHSPNDPITISPKKLPKAPGDETDKASQCDAKSSPVTQLGILPSTNSAAKSDISSLPPVPITPVKDRASGSLHNPGTPSASPDKAGLDTGSMTLFPEPFTPSINKTLNSGANPSMDVDISDGKNAYKKIPTPLPEGLTVASLKNRLSGKKIKGALLSPKEMEELTEPWRPYRSLGVFYMWALAEETPSK